MLRFALLSTIVSTSCRETEARGHDVSAVPCDISSATLVPTSLCNFQFQSALVCIRRATRPGLSRSTCTPVCPTKALEPRPGTKALEPSHETMYASPRRSASHRSWKDSRQPCRHLAPRRPRSRTWLHARTFACFRRTVDKPHVHLIAVRGVGGSGDSKHAWHRTGCNRWHLLH